MNKTGYLAGMEDIGSEMMERTLALREGGRAKGNRREKQNSARFCSATKRARGRAFGADRASRSARKSGAFRQQYRRFYADLHLQLLRQSVRLLRL